MVQAEAGFSGKIITNDKISLFYKNYPVEDEKARILLVHGLCEHCGRYGHLINLLNENNIGIWTYDHRGHGQSGGKRGHIESFSNYIDDLSLILEKALSGKPDSIPFFLLGHSMGGLIVINYIQRHADRIDGVIASSPGLAPAQKLSSIMKASARFLSKITPSLPLDNQLNPEHLSHDHQVVENYINDPLVHRKVTARWVDRYTTAMEDTAGNAPLVKIPILMQVAGDDRIVNPDTSVKFFENLSSPDKTLHLYEGLYHEIYNETNAQRQRVLTDLTKWLDEHIAKF